MASAATVGEFRVWLMDGSGAWHVGQMVPVQPGAINYNTSFVEAVSVASGHRAAVYYRPTIGSGAWAATAKTGPVPTVTPAP
jgi:hypothetical protein